MTAITALLLVAATAPIVKGSAAATLQTPAAFFHHGALVHAQNVVVVQVYIDRPGEFEPRAQPGPVFFYGHAACEPLDSPLVKREVALLCPELGAGEPALLWKARPVDPTKVDTAQAERWLAQAIAAKLATPVPPPQGARATYANKRELQRAVVPAHDGGLGPSPEVP